MRITTPLMVALLCCVSVARAAPTAEEIKQLGTTLTPCGANKAASADGSIPPYTGGLPTDWAPRGWQKDSGRYVSPYPDDKPLFTVTAQNVAQYADKLTEGQKQLFKTYPEFRMNVYPTRRTARLPQAVQDACIKNASSVSLSPAGHTLKGLHGTIPFPLPKSGIEVVFNHLYRYNGTASEWRVDGWYVDASGTPILANESTTLLSYPLAYPGMTPERFSTEYGNLYARFVAKFVAPARTAGEANLLYLSTDGDNTSVNIAYSYTPGQRRVRLAPDFAYDSPIMQYGSVPLFDDVDLVFGKQDRFDHKLLGKKEVFIPYNNHGNRLTDPKAILTPKFPNPDFVRWELHRTWVVEMTLKSGFRHVSPKRRVYIDEDTYGGGASESWDSSGKLYKLGFNSTDPLWDVEMPDAQYATYIDLARGIYVLNLHMGKPASRWLRLNINPLPDNKLFTPENLQMTGVR